MARLEITRRIVRALAGYHQLLEACRRIGNIARARSRVLREEWSACGLEPAQRGPECGRRVFQGVLLTPRAAHSVSRGLRPSGSGFCLHAGVLLESADEAPEWSLRNPGMPELQVGLWLDAAGGADDEQLELIESIRQRLESLGYSTLQRTTEIYPVDSEAQTLLPGYSMVRRLSLASLLDEDDPGAAAGRFFASALKPLEQLEDEQIESLLLATGHGDVYERELPR